MDGYRWVIKLLMACFVFYLGLKQVKKAGVGTGKFLRGVALSLLILAPFLAILALGMIYLSPTWAIVVLIVSIVSMVWLTNKVTKRYWQKLQAEARQNQIRASQSAEP